MPFDRSVVCNLCQAVCYIPKDLLNHLDEKNHKVEERKLEIAKNKYLRQQGLGYGSEDDTYGPNMGGPNGYMNGPRGHTNGARDPRDYRHGPKDYMKGQNIGPNNYSPHVRRNPQGPKRH